MPNVDKIVLDLNWGPIVAAPIYIFWSTAPSLKFHRLALKKQKITYSNFNSVKLQVPAQDIIQDQVPRDYPTVDGEVGRS